MQPSVEDLLRDSPSYLSLSYKRLSAADIEALARSTTLQTLILKGCAIDDAGAIEIARSATIHALDAGSNAIGDVGAAALARNTTLRTLSLVNNAIGDAGAAALARSASLRTLFLGGNAIGDAGALCLVRSTTLEVLYILDNAITEAGACALVAELEGASEYSNAQCETMLYVKKAIGQYAFRVLSRFLPPLPLRTLILSDDREFVTEKMVQRINDALCKRAAHGMKLSN
jgi:hypothetical protein